MRFAAHKTQAVLTTRKLKATAPHLTLNGTTIRFQGSLKVLGLTVDHQLNFREHLAGARGRA
ncbi:unnamed protein product, partial [Arctia plantaginis]